MAPAGLKFMRRMTNTHCKITERMKIFDQNLKLSHLYRKYKITEILRKWVHVRRMDGDGLPHLIMKYQPC